jgi:putative inorganic carbon (HCO3(-)) transporter
VSIAFFNPGKTLNDRLDFIVFLFFILLMFLAPYSTAVAEVVFVVVFLCGIVKLATCRGALGGAKRLFLMPANLSAWALFLIFGISMVLSSDVSRSFRYWFFKWGEEVLIFYLAQFFLTREKVIFLLKLFIFTALVVFIQAALQYFMRPLVIDGVQGPFNNPNNLGAYCALVIFIIFCGIFVKDTLQRIFYTICFIFCIAVLFFTYCRGALLAVGIGLALIAAVFLRRKSKLAFWLLLIVLTLSIAAYVTFWSSGLVASDNQRIVLLSSAINMFVNAPWFGQGVGLFIMKVQSFGGIAGSYAHNCYLQMLAETGIFGLLSFLCLIGFVLSAAKKYLVDKKDLWGSGLYLGVATFLLHATFDNQLYSARLSLIFWVLLAFLYILAHQAKNEYN